MNQQILVIDDSPNIFPLLKAILAEEPVDVQSATDPGYGLVLAASARPDLILLDVDMPGMNGFEACKKLKADIATVDCPIIFLSAHASMAEKVLGLKLGAADYVTKPFHRAELVARVRASLRTNKVIRSLEEKALLDPLTGLGNRAMFAQRIEAETCLRIRFNSPLSIIMLDIDHFKDINDTYGHTFGDQVLHKIGKIISDLCRTEDVACRFGGEEFVIITPHTAGTDAVILGERIREALACAVWKAEGVSNPILADRKIKVTASFGVAEAGHNYDRSIVQRADDAMYRSKQQGRDRVSLAPPLVEAESAMAA